MAQRLAGEPNNSKFDTQRPEKEVTTTTLGDKNRLDTNSTIANADGTIVNLATEEKQDDIIDNQDSLLDTKVDANSGANIRTSNINIESTQNEILKQLKIMNLHLAILTDITIDKTNIE